MKKLLSGLLTAAMLVSSLAVPVSADYEAAGYDTQALKDTFDTGTADGRTADDGKALQIGAEEADVFRLGTYPEGLDSTKEFFLSFDFKFDTEAGTLNIKSDSSKDNVGPSISFDADGSKKNQNKLVTQTGGSAWQSLGDFTVGEWYTMEIEGITGDVNKLPTCRLYNYPSETKTLVQETKSMNFRNLGSSGRHFSFMLGTNVTVDNVLIVQENPDTIEVTTTSANDEMNAGTNISLDYTMKRGEVEFTKYPVEWSIAETDPVGVSLNGTSLVADITAPEQTVTVQAKAVFGEQELVGEKAITIKAVDTSNEKFNVITVAGESEIKAGTSGTYTVTATKEGNPVELEDGDVVWKVYNADNLKENGNKYIKLENGNLTVDDSVLPQKIHVRAESKSGNISGYAEVSITQSDTQTEQVYLSDACETDVSTVERVEGSIDGSAAYHTTAATAFEFGDQAEYVLTEFDFKLDADGSGARLKRKDGTELSSFVLNGGNLAQQTGGSKFEPIVSSIDTSKWYHFEMLYKAGTGAECNVYPYNEDGTLGEKQSIHGLNRRNDKNYGKLEIQAGTYVDNVKISAPSANEIVLDVPRETLFAGESLQCTATASRNGLTIVGATGLTWDVLDSEGLPIIGDDALIKLSSTGLLTVDAMTPAQTVTIRVTSALGQKVEKNVTIQTSEIFKINQIGVNEEKTRIEKLYVEKQFNYNDNVVFIIAIHNKDGVLTGVKLLQMYGDALNIGENSLAVGYDLPDGFNPDTDKISVMTWTTI